MLLSCKNLNKRVESTIHKSQLDSTNYHADYVNIVRAIETLGWRVVLLSAQKCIAHTKPTFLSQVEEITVRFEGQKIQLESKCLGNKWLDFGRSKHNLPALLKTFEDSPEINHAQAEQVFVNIAQHFAKFTEESAKAEPVNNGIVQLLTPRKGYFFTPSIILVNVLIFLLMVISGVHIMSPASVDLINWGANFRPSTLEGEYWRLLSSCFLHIGLFHLAMNMYAFVYIGSMLEPLLGGKRFITAYLSTGFLASLTSLYWHDLTVSAGASGAIFGMYGVFFALLTSDLIEKTARQQLLKSIAIFIGLNLMIGLNAGIDNAAHIGGLVSGFVIGYLFLPSLKSKNEKTTTVVIAGIVVLSIAIAAYIIPRLSNDIPKYDKGMEEFAHNEERAVWIYNLQDSVSTDEMVRCIKDTGIHYWAENIALLRELDQLEIPEKYHLRNT